jgi:hypothetical protein
MYGMPQYGFPAGFNYQSGAAQGGQLATPLDAATLQQIQAAQAHAHAQAMQQQQQQQQQVPQQQQQQQQQQPVQQSLFNQNQSKLHID